MVTSLPLNSPTPCRFSSVRETRRVHSTVFVEVKIAPSLPTIVQRPSDQHAARRLSLGKSREAHVTPFVEKRINPSLPATMKAPLANVTPRRFFPRKKLSCVHTSPF